MIKRWPVGGALLSLLAASAGCDAFLGLDDKPFETTTITLTIPEPPMLEPGATPTRTTSSHALPPCAFQ